LNNVGRCRQRATECKFAGAHNLMEIQRRGSIVVRLLVKVKACLLKNSLVHTRSMAWFESKRITEKWWYIYWSAAAEYDLQPPARLQFISTLYTTRCVTAELNKLSVIESLVCMKRRFLQSWPLLLKRGWLVYLGLFGLRLRHHDVLGCTGCSYHRELDELSYIWLEASSLLLAVIIALITSCLITSPCYELSIKERGEK